jgi:hypothetical protein
MNNRFNRRNNRMSDFDRNFNLVRNVFWVFFSVAIIFIAIQFMLIGWAGYQLVTDPEGTANFVGTIIGEAVRPVADAVRAE